MVQIINRPIRLLESNEIEASRGTPLWAFNVFRTQMLTSILDFLLDNESSGIEDDYCEKIKLFLGRLVHLAAGLPDGNIFRRSIYSELQKFETDYVTWNKIRGDTYDARLERIHQLKRLRRRRHAIAKKVRIHHHILVKELDLKLVETLYDTLNKLLEEIPGALSKTIFELNSFKKKLDKCA